MKRRIDDAELRVLLCKACDKAKTQSAWAEANGITRQHVSRVLNGGRITRKIAKALGFRRYKGWESEY